MAGWAIDEMLIKKSAAMVLNWPEIETQTFDFATFSRKEKPYSDAKQEYDKQVNEITDWLERARSLRPSYGERPLRQNTIGTSNSKRSRRCSRRIASFVFADRSREIRKRRRILDKQRLRMILAGGSEAYKVKDLLRSKASR